MVRAASGGPDAGRERAGVAPFPAGGGPPVISA
jgi:hypothetical protein